MGAETNPAEIEGGERTIGDLAAKSNAVGQQTGVAGFVRRFKIPLLCLAPLLVVLCLASVVVPIATILITTSRSTTQTLSSGYLGTTMAKIDQQISATLNPLTTFAEMATQAYVVEKAMALQAESDTLAPEFVATMVQWRKNTNLGEMLSTFHLISCFKSRWRPGYSYGDAINLTTVQVRAVFAFPGYGMELLGQYPASGVPGVYNVLPADTPAGVAAGSQPGNYSMSILPPLL
ncbi:hypothetical protein HKX48_007384 [Thoreauomyces humboldtii]|nr:hypothetical protein HKX48_007384 [Thoreauomyces humboldtii]